MPQNLRIKDSDGLPTSSVNRANTLADYLQDKQWASLPLPVDPHITYKDNPLKNTPEINCEDYTIEEFNAAIASSKPKKTPGPDQIPADHWKFLDEDNRHNLLTAINTFANSGTPSQTHSNSRTLSLYTKRASWTTQPTTDLFHFSTPY